MELDFSTEWRILGPNGAFTDEASGVCAARELASTLARMGCRPPTLAEGRDNSPLIVLHEGSGCPDSEPGGRRRPCFSWRASPNYVEIFGDDRGALLRGAYDFLEALGAAWVEPGPEGERLPTGPILGLSVASRRNEPTDVATTLILGHRVFIERWEDYLSWAPRAGYSSVFIHTSPDPLPMGAVPQRLYEDLRQSIAALASGLGLRLELGGHSLSSFLPRSLFAEEPELFRERDGQRLSDRNFCPSNARSLALASTAFAEMAAAHPEISVFHAWPDDLPGGGWCSCPSCLSLSPAAQSLAAAKALATALAETRPDASVSYLAYHDTEDLESVLSAEKLPSNLELLWAPRLRSWGAPLGDPGCGLNAGSLATFRRNSRAWRASGGGNVAVFEYWEDAFLFKSAVPPLSLVIEGDVAAYRGDAPEEAADSIGVLCTGGRLPIAPRPNLFLFPRLASSYRADSGTFGKAIIEAWAASTYGAGSESMLEYWRELEAAWRIDLDLAEGDSAVKLQEDASRFPAEPLADWGDPWKASAERLAAKRDRCEELFDHLRRAEAMLAEARSSFPDVKTAEKLAVEREAAEYAISGSVLELDCARLAVYHELASGDGRAAADIANLALSASGALRKAISRLPDRRSRREMGLLISVFYDLRLRFIRRANARSGIRRLLDLWATTARVALEAATVLGSYRTKGIATRTSRH